MHPNVHGSSLYSTKTWKRPKRLSVDEWIRKMWFIYAMDYYSARKKEQNNAICSNMDRPRDDYTKRSESGRERQAPYEITCVWNLNYDTDEFICETETGSQTQRTDLRSQSGKWGWGGMG